MAWQHPMVTSSSMCAFVAAAGGELIRRTIPPAAHSMRSTPEGRGPPPPATCTAAAVAVAVATAARLSIVCCTGVIGDREPYQRYHSSILSPFTPDLTLSAFFYLAPFLVGLAADAGEIDDDVEALFPTADPFHRPLLLLPFIPDLAVSTSFHLAPFLVSFTAAIGAGAGEVDGDAEALFLTAALFPRPLLPTVRSGHDLRV
ncbi:hypothetical protein GUJ93_ZPchr0006g43879 [Zizania palustris]|uniref:Uncharacterized protein n=1 Tax=Zizania palustris TaxID=103762 RepID=A0A8J5VSD1_ZIZPA|nr:hypothetical protein GUJ93_ZPchr0006g43879 [Zizania palustris]